MPPTHESLKNLYISRTGSHIHKPRELNETGNSVVGYWPARNERKEMNE